LILSDVSSALLSPTLNSFTRVSLEEVILLGAPLFKGHALDEAWSNSCRDLQRASSRLELVGAQDGLTLLKASFSAPRTLHLLRCSPSSDHPGLSEFDSILRTTLTKLANADLNDLQWKQASLPIKEGGLGLRLVSSLASPAYLASAHATRVSQESLLCNVSSLEEDPYLASVLAAWTSSFGCVPPLPAAHLQKAWDAPAIASVKESISSGLTNPREKASFLAASSPHSGAWLNALPLANCGLRIDNEAVRVGVALRLGLQLCAPHDCRCGAPVDAWGDHAFSCKSAPGRIMRHHAVNDVISKAIASTRTPICKEPHGLVPGSSLRPDGSTLIPWKRGKYLAWDATISSTLAASYVDASSTQSGFASTSAAARKTLKYQGLSPQYIFQPVSLETLGSACPSTSAFLAEVGHKISAVSGDPKETAFLRQRLSLCIQRFNAVILKNSFVDGDEGLDE
jgi:hypothetical protein